MRPPPARGTLFVLATTALLLGGCGPYGDGAYAQKQHRKLSERRAAEMRVATAQAPRGAALDTSAIAQTVAGKTWVQRYSRFPDGRSGNYILYRHFAQDGSLLVVDNWLEPSGRQGDWWKAEDERLCTLNQFYSETPSCYRLEQRGDGALQVYIDDPGSIYHQLLTSVITEVIEGPPPVASAAPQDDD